MLWRVLSYPTPRTSSSRAPLGVSRQTTSDGSSTTKWVRKVPNSGSRLYFSACDCVGVTDDSLGDVRIAGSMDFSLCSWGQEFQND